MFPNMIHEIRSLMLCDAVFGRCKLAELMHCGSYGDEDNMHQDVYVDLVYDHIEFSVSEGFPWQHIGYILSTLDRFIKRATEKTITEAIKLYQFSSDDLIKSIGKRNYDVYTDFIFSTFFRNFSLIKYVLRNPRQLNIPHINLDVRVPVPPLPLSSSKKESVWSYELKIEQLDGQQAVIHEKCLRQLGHIKDELTMLGKDCFGKVEGVQRPFTMEAVSDIVKEMVVEYASVTSQALTNTILNLQADLDIKLQTSVLPRPALLGPSPRYNLKSPIILPANTAHISMESALKKEKKLHMCEMSTDAQRRPKSSSSQSNLKSSKTSSHSRGSSRS